MGNTKKIVKKVAGKIASDAKEVMKGVKSVLAGAPKSTKTAEELNAEASGTHIPVPTPRNLPEEKPVTPVVTPEPVKEPVKETPKTTPVEVKPKGSNIKYTSVPPASKEESNIIDKDSVCSRARIVKDGDALKLISCGQDCRQHDKKKCPGNLSAYAGK